MSRFASSSARDLAAEHGIDDVDIVGTGRDGSITIADVRAAVPARPPEQLGEHGRSFWLAVRRQWKLRPDEDALLLAAASTIDELARLEEALAKAGSTVVAGSRGQTVAHPLLAECRAHRLALRQLLGSLGLAEASAGTTSRHGDARSDAGRKLALLRHNRGRG